MAEPPARALQAGALERLGRRSVALVEEWGYYAALLFEGLYWVVAGPFRRQPVRASAVVREMMEVGIRAVPILATLSFAIGVMLAIQGVYSLRAFGAESQVVMAVVLSISREFGALMTGVLVAGRTGSALAARIGTMTIAQEVDALRVMGINPVRYLVSPVLVAMIIMVPAMTVMADLVAMAGGATYCVLRVGLSFQGFVEQAVAVMKPADLWQGITKSYVFALIIALVGVSNGFLVSGGADGVGRAATRAVVLGISYIIVADMIFTYFLSR